MRNLMSLEDLFYGSATIGERGQVVIPSDARKQCEMNPGDKVLVFRHPMHPHMLLLAKVGEMQEMLDQMKRALETAHTLATETIEDEE